jgi:V8-like Glu-specific endopeptidase
MNKSVQLAVLTSVLLSQGAMARVIYGDDHRKEVSEATPFQQKLAASAATMISENEMTTDPAKPGLVQLNQRSLRNWLESQLENDKKQEKLFSPKVLEAAKNGVTFCDDERFTEQPNPGMCSGFLIAPDLIMTAGHCVDMPAFCSEYRWVFGFQVDSKTNKAGFDIKDEDIYKCKKVVSNTLSGALGLDYAIVQLDRVVKGREPLEIRNNSKVEINTELVVIGSPSGLPLKVAGGAKVRKNTHPNYFSANLDTFQGNSGSAVFNAETGVVEGILVRGENDFVQNPTKMCIEANKCADNACRGEDVSRLTSIPEVSVQAALYKAASTGDLVTIERILKLNVWVDFYGKDGQSALMKASIAGEMKAMELLIKKGADVNLKDAEGNSVAMLALKHKKNRAVKLLMSNGSEDPKPVLQKIVSKK